MRSSPGDADVSGPQGGDGVTWAGALHTPLWLGLSGHAQMVAAAIGQPATLHPTPASGCPPCPEAGHALRGGRGEQGLISG